MLKLIKQSILCTFLSTLKLFTKVLDYLLVKQLFLKLPTYLHIFIAIQGYLDKQIWLGWINRIIFRYKQGPFQSGIIHLYWIIILLQILLNCYHHYKNWKIILTVFSSLGLNFYYQPTCFTPLNWLFRWYYLIKSHLPLSPSDILSDI